jgi:catechol 2,3-dioxygenase-like lactoylglutathione lyase family enzyme
MLDHMTFRVADLARTEAFYTPTLAALGYRLAHRFAFDGQQMIGYACPAPHLPTGEQTDTWFVQGPSPHGGPAVSTGAHLCWSAQARARVDAFYAAAVAAGARDNGAPGLRPHYHEHYYGAFVIDPDGNNIEACCHLPE